MRFLRQEKYKYFIIVVHKKKKMEVFVSSWTTSWKQ